MDGYVDARVRVSVVADNLVFGTGVGSGYAFHRLFLD
jgi:hypothetical protein